MGYLIVLAIDASLEGGWALGVAMVYSCGLALRDLDFSRLRVGGGGGGGGGCDPDPAIIGSSIGFLSLSFMCCTNSDMLIPILSSVLPSAWF